MLAIVIGSVVHFIIQAQGSEKCFLMNDLRFAGQIAVNRRANSLVSPDLTSRNLLDPRALTKMISVTMGQ